MQNKNLFPLTDQINQDDRAYRLGQWGKVFWLVGLSGSGKSALATRLEKSLFQSGYHVVLLDGDTIRTGINRDLNFSESDRMENIRRIAEISKLFCNAGQICIVSFITPLESMRTLAAEIIGEDKFVEVFIDTPLSICEQRDVKGLYKKARAGEIKEFTGISSPFEPPVSPDVHIQTINQTPEQSFDVLLEKVQPYIRIIRSS